MASSVSDPFREEVQEETWVKRGRPTPGIQGESHNLIANQFPIQWKQASISRYVVDFVPELSPQEGVKRRSVLRKFREKIDEHYGIWVFDGISMLASKEVADSLEFKTGEEAITIRPNKKKNQATNQIQTANVENMSEAYTIVNVMFKRFMRSLGLLQLGRNYYNKTPHEIRQFDLNLYQGFSANIAKTTDGLMLKVGVSHRVVRQKTVRDIMKEIREDVENRYSHLQRADRQIKYEEAVLKEIRGRTVLTTYNQRQFQIKDVRFDMDATSTFKLKDKEVTFIEYYRDRYNRNIEHVEPGLLLHVPKYQKIEIFIIPELCYLTGLNDQMRGNFRLMKAIADKTKLSPNDRLTKLTGFISDMNRSEEMQKKGAPFKIAEDPARLKSRLLGPFHMELKQGDHKEELNVSGTRCDFGASYRRAGVINATPISKWVLIFDNRSQHLANTLSRGMGTVANRNGMSNLLARPIREGIEVGRREPDKDWHDRVREIIERHRPQMVLCLIPDRPETVYGAVKRACVVDTGVLSQCVLEKNLKNQKKVIPLAGNVLKQMLTKNGAEPWRVKLSLPSHANTLNQTTMICGMDTHRNRGKGDNVIGFTASTNRDYAKFSSSITFQPRSKMRARRGKVPDDVTIIDAASSIMIRAIKSFNKANQTLPANIIIYRNGVGEGQLDFVITNELKGFKNAFKQVREEANVDYFPKLTILVVETRVSERFFTERMLSPDPGTVIDTGIVSPTYNDFYLVPCRAHPTAGTASPTRYICVWDDIEFTPDDIQSLTNQLCLGYFNWPGPIRIPAPCMYASKIAFLCGKCMRMDNDQTVQETLSNSLFYL